VNLSPRETRLRAQGFLRRYLFQGLPPTEAQRAVCEHPDFAGKPPSFRAVQKWWGELVQGDPITLVNPELLAAAGHSLEDHRKAAIARSSARIMKLRVLADALYADLGGLKPNEHKRRAQLEARVLETDKRLGDAERSHAAIIGYDEVPLAEQLTDDVGRSRVVHALHEGWRYFTDAEAEALYAGLAADLERRRREAAEDAEAQDAEA
jgi:hypothetical protein